MLTGSKGVRDGAELLKPNPSCQSVVVETVIVSGISDEAVDTSETRENQSIHGKNYIPGCVITVLLVFCAVVCFALCCAVVCFALFIPKPCKLCSPSLKGRLTYWMMCTVGHEGHL